MFDSSDSAEVVVTIAFRGVRGSEPSESAPRDEWECSPPREEDKFGIFGESEGLEPSCEEGSSPGRRCPRRRRGEIEAVIGPIRLGGGGVRELLLTFWGLLLRDPPPFEEKSSTVISSSPPMVFRRDIAASGTSIRDSELSNFPALRLSPFFRFSRRVDRISGYFAEDCDCSDDCE